MDLPPSYNAAVNSNYDFDTKQQQQQQREYGFDHPNNTLPVLPAPLQVSSLQQYNTAPVPQSFFDYQASNPYKTQEQRNIEEKYPVKFVIVYSVIVIVLNVVAIPLQIVMLVKKKIFSEVAAGIWIPAYFIVLAILALLLIKYRIYKFYNVIVVFYLLGFFLTFGCLFVLNILPYVNPCYPKLRSSNCSYDAPSQVYHLVMVIIAGLNGIIISVYFFYVNNLIAGRTFSGSGHRHRHCHTHHRIHCHR